jgi:hypothetical protein
LTIAFDYRLYDFDLTLGIKPSAWMGQIVQTSQLLNLVILASYYAIVSVMIAVAAAAEHVAERPRATPPLFACFVVGAMIAMPLYWLVPAIGPMATFGAAFPNALPTATAVGTAIFVPKWISVINAMPSMHMAWAVMVLWTSWELPWPGRLGGALFFLLTPVATLGLGEHYLIDLVAGTVVALLARALCMTSLSVTDPLRATVLGVAVAVLAFWFVPRSFRLAVVARRRPDFAARARLDRGRGDDHHGF